MVQVFGAPLDAPLHKEFALNFPYLYIFPHRFASPPAPPFSSVHLHAEASRSLSKLGCEDGKHY
jgi:hypothetical protein